MRGWYAAAGAPEQRVQLIAAAAPRVQPALRQAHEHPCRQARLSSVNYAVELPAQCRHSSATYAAAKSLPELSAKCGQLLRRHICLLVPKFPWRCERCGDTSGGLKTRRNPRNTRSCQCLSQDMRTLLERHVLSAPHLPYASSQPEVGAEPRLQRPPAHQFVAIHGQELLIQRQPAAARSPRE